MDPAAIETLFTRPDGSFLCARWGRPVAPVVFGLADDSLDIFRGAIRAGFAHARHPVVDTDPETGANLMLFFVRDWPDLADIPDLGRLTDAERAALAEGSVKAWQGQSDNGRFNENVREAVDGVRNDPAAREALAAALKMLDMAVLRLGWAGLSGPDV